MADANLAQISEIMSLLVFHTSRRQLVEFLTREIEEILETTDDKSAKKRRIALINAVEVVYRDYKGVEFWGDARSDMSSVKGKEPICSSRA